MNIPEELLPIVEWWEKDGKQTVATLVIVGIAVAGFYGYRHFKEVRRLAAGDAVFNAYTIEELESSVADFGDTSAGPGLKMRMARGYYDARRFDEALAVYSELEKAPAAGFEEVPAVGIAQCLEGLEKYAEATQAFDAFVERHPDSFLKLTAQLGAVRCLAQAGDRGTALKRLEALEQANDDDEMAKSRIKATSELVKRWEKREQRSLVDEAAQAAAALEVPEAAAGEVPVAEEADPAASQTQPVEKK